MAVTQSSSSRNDKGSPIPTGLAIPAATTVAASTARPTGCRPSPARTGTSVKEFEEKHNHPLATPKKTHLLRSHRVVSATKRALVQELLEITSGGPSMMGCLEKDIRNEETSRYPCRHMLCWMRVEQVMLLPKEYVKERWTKNAKSTLLYDTPHDFVESKSLQGRYGALMHMARELIDDASLTEARSNFLTEKFKYLKGDVAQIDDGECKGKCSSKRQNRDEMLLICDPEPVRTKGCGKRLKSSKEKAMSKSARTCSSCHQNGHDKRKCPSYNIRLEDDPYRTDMFRRAHITYFNQPQTRYQHTMAFYQKEELTRSNISIGARNTGRRASEIPIIYKLRKCEICNIRLEIEPEQNPISTPKNFTMLLCRMEPSVWTSVENELRAVTPHSSLIAMISLWIVDA
ncbi:FAR1-related protein [Striga asiatica]|uniref:FAR1-related protein n=1 Tax=Striga asiatica TaxID=4170 RepID=A0A5A7QXF9_STRAF|nr:FAR1-related protein [Striga asiatica]